MVLTQIGRQKSGAMGYKEHAKKAGALGSRMLKQGQIACPEALSQVTFKNALTFFNSRDIESIEDDKAAQPYRDAIQRCLGLLR